MYKNAIKPEKPIILDVCPAVIRYIQLIRNKNKKNKV
jgi:hypothetical protein